MKAVERALSVSNSGGQYVLGTGDYRPHTDAHGAVVDVPWTARERDGVVGSDCAGLVVWCHELRRHRPGYNVGGAYDVENDLNCNSMLGDAMGKRELFTLVMGNDKPQPGDVLAYPSFYLYDSYKRPLLHEGKPLHWIGHTGIVVGTMRVDSWDAATPRWYQLDVAQCHGPDGHTPGVVLTDGSAWSAHDRVWPKPEHRTYLIRRVS